MFERLFKLFRKPVVEISVEGIPAFVNSSFSKMNNLHKGYAADAIEILRSIRSKCEALKTATLRNENIPVRAKQIMEGNRAAYIRITLQLLDEVSRVVDNLDSDTYPVSIQGIRDLLLDYTKGTHKQYFVLQEFFAVESRDIASEIKRIDDGLERFRKTLSDSNYFSLKEVKGLLDEKAMRFRREEDLKSKREMLKSELDDGMANIRSLRVRSEEIRNSERYADLIADEAELKRFEAAMKSLNDHVLQTFSPLGRALRKYAKVSLDVEFSERLSADAVELMRMDAGIVDRILRGLEKNIRGLDLKENVVEKDIAVLKELDLGWIRAVQADYAQIYSNIDSVKRKLQSNDVKAQLFDIEREILHHETAIELCSRRLQGVEHEIEQSDGAEIDVKIRDVLSGSGVIINN